MGEWRYSTAILDFTTKWRLVLSFKPRPLYLRERAPVTSWIGGWVILRVFLEAVE
jgi:hypothetical protein